MFSIRDQWNDRWSLVGKPLPVYLFLLSILLAGCATIFKGSKAELRFRTDPSGAEILVDQVDRGATPATLELPRDESHVITFRKEGYEDITVKVDKDFDFETTIVGNLFSWGVLGLVVDIATGAAYTLSPAEIRANMDELKVTGLINPRNPPEDRENGIYVVMLTKEEWEQVKKEN